jgi:UMF1 family MFS transporter
MDRRTIGAWCLYDFGNSAFAILFPAMFGAYYADFVVGGNAGAKWWGFLVSASMLLVALSSPFLGGIADHSGNRKRILGVYTGLALLCVLSFNAVGQGMIVAGFVVGALANFAFEGGIVFYNAYLPDIAPPSHQGRVSARGFAIGYAGSLVALAVAAPLADAGLMAWVWVALAIQWVLAALPAFLILPPDRRTGMGIVAAARLGFQQTFETWREVLKLRDLRRFLLAYFFYMDGVNTVIMFASVYAKLELGFETADLILLLGLVQISALVGSAALGRATDLKGPRWAVRNVLLWWILVVVAAYFATTRPRFWVVAVLAGVGLGSIQAASRTLMARLIPDGREAEFFGFYALCGKTGAVLGPTLFGLISDWTGTQRPAVLSVVAFYVVGYLLLGRVRVGDGPRT